MKTVLYKVILFLKFDRLGVIVVSSIFEFRGHFLMTLRSGGLVFEGLGSLFW